MIKKYLKTALIIILTINLCGCAELGRKFIRKKKPTKADYSFYSLEEYKPKPADESYQDHYVLWRNWHLDLERIGDTSYLKDIRAANEAIKHLTEMRDLLKDEKAKELEAQIKDMEIIVERLKEKRRDIIKDVHSRRLLEKVGRVIVNNFSYNRMKEYIKSERLQKE